MAIILPEHNLMIIEFPRTGTTWLRQTLKRLDIPREIPLPNGNVCPRHSPAGCYDWVGRCAVVYREPRTWIKSMWRYHRGRGHGKLNSGTKYWFEFMMPFNDDWVAWKQNIDLSLLYSYYMTMLDGCHTVVPFAEFQDWVEELLGVEVPRERVNASSLSP